MLAAVRVDAPRSQPWGFFESRQVSNPESGSVAGFRRASRIAAIQVSEILEIGARAAAMRRQGRPVIVLGAGEPDFDTPDHVKEAAVRAIAQGQTKYTLLDGTLELEAAIAAKFARENGITVTLDGQGADELLAGYHGYPGQRMLSLFEQGRYGAMHGFARRWSQWPGRSYRHAWMYMGRSVFPDGLYERARKVLGRDFQPGWLRTDMLREAGVAFQETRPALAPSNRGRRVVEQLAYSLQTRGLPHLLRHGDRNAMAFSIESRVPFLTPPMAQLLLSLPESYLISDAGETKHVFRAAMRGIVPDEILDRRDKIGFATPERDWFMSIAPMTREWLQDAAAVPFLDPAALLAAFDGVIAGRTPFTWQVWRWVNYVRWYRGALS